MNVTIYLKVHFRFATSCNTFKNPLKPLKCFQFGSECYCGDSYDKYGQLNESACSSNCFANSSEVCGGSKANSVYSGQQILLLYLTFCLKQSMPTYFQWPNSTMWLCLKIIKCSFFFAERNHMHKKLDQQITLYLLWEFDDFSSKRIIGWSFQCLISQRSTRFDPCGSPNPNSY